MLKLLLFLASISPSLLQETVVAGPPVEVQVRVNVGIVELSSDVRLKSREITSSVPASK